MNNDLVEKIKDSIDILDLVSDYVPTIKKGGRIYKACCPFHQEKTPSFTVSPDKGLFYCFGCQAGGDIFDFIMKIESLNFTEALHRLADRAGIPWQQEEYLSEAEKSRLSDYKLMASAKDFYHRQLLSPKGQTAMDYLKSRNITEATIEKFQLGLSFNDSLVRTALKNGYNAQTLRKLGLMAVSSSDYFKNRLLFPILSHRGDCVGFGGRILGEGQPKYLNSPETPLFSKSRVLYALNFAGPSIRKAGKVILLEGYMDVIACHQAGAENCVAPLGTSFSAEHAKLLKRYTDTAIVLFDPDEAGIKASLRAALILVQNGIYVKVASLSDGLDPDEYIAKYGVEGFYKAVDSAKDIINFRLDCILKGAQSISPKDRADITAEIIEIIKTQPEPIIRNEWILLAANRLGIDPEIIARKVKPAEKKTAEQKNAAPQAKDNTPQSELDLVRVLLKAPRYIELCAELTEEHFENKNIWLILKEIETLRAERPDIEEVAAHLAQNNEALHNIIIKYSMQPLPEGLRPQKEAEACIRTLKRTALLKRYKQVQRILAGYPPGGAPLDLLKEQIEIQKKLKS